MKNIFKIIGSIFLCWSLLGCMEYKEIELVEVKRVYVKVFSINEIRLAVDMQINNPNKYKVAVTEAEMELYIKGKKIGNTLLDNKIVLPKKSNEVHQAIILTPVKEMSPSAIPTLLKLIGQPSAPIHLKGYVKGRVKGVSKKIPVDYKDVVKF